MNKVYLLSALIIAAFSSCRTPYEPDINADQRILVVDAFLSDQPHTSHVRLTLAAPYDSSITYPAVQNATVFITDNNLEVYDFVETNPGYYEPVESDFAGAVDATYILTVTTPDGKTYESDPQIILPNMEPMRVYGGFDRIEYLEKDNFGKTIKISKRVCAMYFDYTGNTSTPRFRYNSSQLLEYKIDKILFSINCWKTETDNNLRFTYQNYASTSVDILKQEICTSPPVNNIQVYDIVPNPDLSSSEPWISKDSLIDVYEYKRIIEIKQYRINDDTYKYYKAVKNQSDAEGKIFDPIISQLNGNITCTSDPSNPVFGFFEASSLSTTSYIIKRYDYGGIVTFTRVDNVSPHIPEGFMIAQFPDFWIQ